MKGLGKGNVHHAIDKFVKGADADAMYDEHSTLDAKEFIVPGADERGLSARAQTRVQPGHYRQAELIVKKGMFPFINMSDFVRYGFLLALKRCIGLVDMGIEIRTLSRQTDVIMDMCRQQQFMVEFGATIEMLNKTVQDQLTHGAEHEAVKLVALCKAQIGQMPDGFWKEKYMKALMDRHGGLLKGSKEKGGK